ncbi:MULTISPECIES: pyridoxal-phosphate dependent enzyme [Acidianus]|uniref:Threonine synthase n=1 Tax=Candidatus Acidianus copahuensis TaxID=1160895 RepID=A0A031LP18_9CREN|nr:MULTISPECIES: pyridoxal-phosphate dependent enzyme [Acidianus]EZQ06756.1 threonine synthase [Candidatus Acidianus copahuensis]NON62365.1 pyridoxal-phosphate dependent enzyme [Acidianus sp. RZ1]
MKVICARCGKERESMEVRCKRCGGPFKVDLEDLPLSKNMRENFPYLEKWISLGEWNTPLIMEGKIMYKLDFLNPTGSYKDRGSVTLISYLKQKGITSISEDSSGNAGASIAAYGSAAGMSVKIFVPSSARGAKLRQIEAYGSKVIKVDGSREDVSRAAESSGSYYASHVLQPFFRDGIRSLAYELARQAQKIDEVFIPTSAGTLLLGLFEGFRHLTSQGIIRDIPKLIAVQTEQVMPVCSKLNGVQYSPPEKVTSLADALVSTNPFLLKEMIDILKKYGECVVVNEDEILSSWRELARKGLYVEYSSATTLAALKKQGSEGFSVLLLTGSGLKIG